MKTLAVLHYHLRPGGVTTVIRNAERALAGDYKIHSITDIGYNQKPARSRNQFLQQSRSLRDQLAGRLAQVELLQTHNIGLGKNPRLTCAVKMLAETGAIKILNQVHDFPEENRQQELHALRHCTGKRDDKFFKSICYYNLPSVRWATLTTSDAAKLHDHGVPRSRIDVLPNPINDPFFLQSPPQPAELQDIRNQLERFARKYGYGYNPRLPLLLSPMKVMERKNNAEAVELVRRLKNAYQLLITLGPGTSKTYADSIERRIRRDRLPVVIGFGLELQSPLPLFHLARAVLTTSKVEGFGYTFVEGWLCNKLVVGRNIPGVTKDFAAAGMKLGHLYAKFDETAVATLSRMLQQPPAALIRHNRDVVLREYGLKAYRRRFAELSFSSSSK